MILLGFLLVAASGYFASKLAGAEAVKTRLSFALPGDQVLENTPFIPEMAAGAMPVVLLVITALAYGLIVRGMGMDLASALAAVAAAIVVELMVALWFRGFGTLEEVAREIETLFAPMLVTAVLVAVVTGAVLALIDNPPTRTQLGGLRRVAALVLLVGMLGVTAALDASWSPWFTALPVVLVAWCLFKPVDGQSSDRPLRAAIVLGALLLFAVALVAREHRWEGRVLGAVIVLALVTLWLARAQGAWAGRALAVGGVAVGVGALAAVAAAHEDPTPVRAVVALTRDNELSCGIHITTLGRTEVYVKIGGGRRDVIKASRDDLAGYVDKEASMAGWRTEARRLADDMLDGRRVPRATTRSEFCQPDRPPAPRPTEGLPVAQRFQPDLSLPAKGDFWPVSLLVTYGLRDRGHGACVQTRGPTLRCGLDDGVPWSGGHGRWLEYPSNERSTSRQRNAMTAVLGSSEPDRSALQYYLASRGQGGTWNIQYWSFYVFNFQDDTPGGYHEGDFELTGLVLSAGRRPRYVWMSRHKAYEGRPFAFGEPVFNSQNHIDIHVARGSHAAYEHCGRHRRPGLPPDDHAACGDARYLLRPQLSDLALAPWACWEGAFGHWSGPGRAGDVLGNGPRSPLWQQTFDEQTAEPCRAVAEDPDRPGNADEAEPDDASTTLRDAAGRLEWQFDECSDWDKPPATGAYLVACDQRALDRFFASGLEDTSAARVQITGVGLDPREPMVPAVWRAPERQDLSKPRILAPPRASLRVYAVCDTEDGQRAEVTFEGAQLKAGGAATIDDADGSSWLLRDADGKVLARDEPNRLTFGRTDGRPKPGPEVDTRCRR